MSINFIWIKNMEWIFTWDIIKILFEIVYILLYLLLQKSRENLLYGVDKRYDR